MVMILLSWHLPKYISHFGHKLWSNTLDKLKPIVKYNTTKKYTSFNNNNKNAKKINSKQKLIMFFFSFSFKERYLKQLTLVCCSHSPRETGPPDGFHDNCATATSSPSSSLASSLSSLSLEQLDTFSLSETFSASCWSVRLFGNRISKCYIIHCTSRQSICESFSNVSFFKKVEVDGCESSHPAVAIIFLSKLYITKKISQAFPALFSGI